MLRASCRRRVESADPEGESSVSRDPTPHRSSSGSGASNDIVQATSAWRTVSQRSLSSASESTTRMIAQTSPLTLDGFAFRDKVLSDFLVSLQSKCEIDLLIVGDPSDRTIQARLTSAGSSIHVCREQPSRGEHLRRAPSATSGKLTSAGGSFSETARHGRNPTQRDGTVTSTVPPTRRQSRRLRSSTGFDSAAPSKHELEHSPARHSVIHNILQHSRETCRLVRRFAFAYIWPNSQTMGRQEVPSTTSFKEVNGPKPLAKLG